jgi:hypothetical protein
MAIYEASVIIERLYIDANTEAQAEEKYDAWQDGADCPEHAKPFGECECVYHHYDCDHTMEVYR